MSDEDPIRVPTWAVIAAFVLLVVGMVSRV